MKKSTKAVLLSALIFPGTGHLYLQKYISGTVLFGTALAGVGYSVSRTVEIISRVLGEIQNGAVPLDAAAIAELVSRQSTGPQVQLLNIATAVLAVCWLVGAVDSYRLGRQLERQEQVSVAQ